MDSWDVSYLKLAEFWASQRSKDPSTKVGAVIVRPDKTMVSTGFNGFPPRCSDAPELYSDRNYKMATIIHAEENALLTAREPVIGYTIYISGLPPCAHCASLLIRAGIRRVVTFDRPIPERWRENMMFSLFNLISANVSVHLINEENGRIWPVVLDGQKAAVWEIGHSDTLRYL